MFCGWGRLGGGGEGLEGGYAGLDGGGRHKSGTGSECSSLHHPPCPIYMPWPVCLVRSPPHPR